MVQWKTFFDEKWTPPHISLAQIVVSLHFPASLAHSKMVSAMTFWSSSGVGSPLMRHWLKRSRTALGSFLGNHVKMSRLRPLDVKTEGLNMFSDGEMTWVQCGDVFDPAAVFSQEASPSWHHQTWQSLLRSVHRSWRWMISENKSRKSTLSCQWATQYNLIKLPQEGCGFSKDLLNTAKDDVWAQGKAPMNSINTHKATIYIRTVIVPIVWFSQCLKKKNGHSKVMPTIWTEFFQNFMHDT